ncbi:hypothetical protein FQZ97_1077140 [compost metagenome]
MEILTLQITQKAVNRQGVIPEIMGTPQPGNHPLICFSMTQYHPIIFNRDIQIIKTDLVFTGQP